MHPECLGLFAKYWEPGLVKTRLAREIGPQKAAEVHCALTVCSASRFRTGKRRHVLALSPYTDEARSGFERAEFSDWVFESQVEGDLGQRMHAFISKQFSMGAGKVVLLGADSPHLPVERIESAFRVLDHAQVVLGPSEDGGYYLVGVSRRVPRIFEGIPWGTEDVWNHTVDRLQSAAIPYKALETWYDVDHLADLHRLRTDLSRSNDPRLAALRGQLQDILSSETSN